MTQKSAKTRKGPSQRQLQAGELIRRALSDILIREDFRDPVLDGVSVTITEVRTSPDLRHGRVFAVPLGDKTNADSQAVIAALNRASKFLRGRLGRELSMKSTPALRFELDETFDTAAQMNELLARPEIKRDLE